MEVSRWKSHALTLFTIAFSLTHFLSLARSLALSPHGGTEMEVSRSMRDALRVAAETAVIATLPIAVPAEFATPVQTPGLVSPNA